MGSAYTGIGTSHPAWAARPGLMEGCLEMRGVHITGMTLLADDADLGLLLAADTDLGALLPVSSKMVATGIIQDGGYHHIIQDDLSSYHHIIQDRSWWYHPR